ncbi:DivIVA domain-containing protein [Pseudoclavibacter helvolus]|uniref:Cell wall synthesis protein Wag31 n=1 Tax=Pseudoclavibacter helvolus TaxID=255205 RepID=A0A7W4UL19_9MICO|nr:DivIVA domain-containing protein [Pseudoclavibacter helvolus]MBB2956407.1 DivIVA domain-containing protein [Pseudoclavibacter helvolus]
MALTPEDVINKRFQQTKFREGYDQDEVDDFLDEVVAEMRRLVGENEQLRQQLAEAEARADSASAAAAPAPVEEPIAPLAQPAAPAPVVAQGADEAETSSSLIALARRLHDEHVQEGTRKRDEIIATGETRAREIIAEAEGRARTIVTEAEAKERETIGRLEEAKTKLEARIEELRIFEREYRNNLRSYIEGQLNDLNRQASDVLEGSAPAGQ